MYKCSPIFNFSGEKEGNGKFLLGEIPLRGNFPIHRSPLTCLIESASSDKTLLPPMPSPKNPKRSLTMKAKLLNAVLSGMLVTVAVMGQEAPSLEALGGIRIPMVAPYTKATEMSFRPMKGETDDELNRRNALQHPWQLLRYIHAENGQTRGSALWPDVAYRLNREEIAASLDRDDRHRFKGWGHGVWEDCRDKSIVSGPSTPEKVRQLAEQLYIFGGGGYIDWTYNLSEAETAANYDLWHNLKGRDFETTLKERDSKYATWHHIFQSLSYQGVIPSFLSLGRSYEEYGLFEEYLKEYAEKLASGEEVKHELPKPYEVWLATQQQFLEELNDENGEWKVNAPLVLRYPLAVNYEMMGNRKKVASEAKLTLVEADEVHTECMSRVARGRVELARAQKEYVPSGELVARVKEGEAIWKGALKYGSAQIDPNKPIIYVCDVNFDAQREDIKAAYDTSVVMEEKWNDERDMTQAEANTLHRYHAGGVFVFQGIASIDGEHNGSKIKVGKWYGQFRDGRIHKRHWNGQQRVDVTDLGMWPLAAAEFAAKNKITYIFPKPYAYNKPLMEAHGIQLVDCTEEVWKIVDAYVWRKDKNGVSFIATPENGVRLAAEKGKLGFDVSNESMLVMYRLQRPLPQGVQCALNEPVLDLRGSFAAGGNAAVAQKRGHATSEAMYLLDSVQNPRLTMVNGNDLKGKGLGENVFLKLAIEDGLGKEILKRFDKGEKEAKLVKWITRKCKFDDDRYGTLMLNWVVENRTMFEGRER